VIISETGFASYDWLTKSLNLAYGYFKAAQAKGLTSVDLYNNRAVSSFNLGMADQAVTSLRYALRLDPEHSESRYNLDITYSSKGMPEEAQREMNAAMQLRNKVLLGKQSRFQPGQKITF